MGAATQLLQLFQQILGGSAPAGAASASGDISQMVKYIAGGSVANYQPVSGSKVTELSGYVTIGTSAGLGGSFGAPGTVPTTGCYSVACSPTGKWVANFTNGGTLEIYGWSSAGWGSRISSTAIGLGQIFNGAFSPNGDYLAIATANTPYIKVYAFNDTTGALGAAVSDPASLPVGTPKSICWSPTQSYIMAAISGTVYTYPWSAGFGARASSAITNFAEAYQGGGFALSPDGTMAAYRMSSAPYIEAAPVTAAGVVGTAYAANTGWAAGSNGAIFWSPQSDAVSSVDGTGKLNISPIRNGTGWGTNFNTGVSGDCAPWTPDGQFVVVTYASGCSVFPVDRLAGTVGLALAGTVNPAGSGSGVIPAIIHVQSDYASGKYVVIFPKGTTSPYMQAIYGTEAILMWTPPSTTVSLDVQNSNGSKNGFMSTTNNGSWTQPNQTQAIQVPKSGSIRFNLSATAVRLGGDGATFHIAATRQ